MKAREKITDREAYKQKRHRDDIIKILDMAEGRRVFWRLLCECGVFQVGIPNPDLICFNEGKRDIGVKILKDIMDCKPEKFIQMQKEFKAEFTVDKKLAEDLRTEEEEEI